MPSFLFTAVDGSGKSVTERVEAENLSAARYKLEIRGYSEITFYESELSQEIINLFDENSNGGRDKYLQQQVGIQHDTSIGRFIFNALKVSAIAWILILGGAYLTQSLISFLILGGSVLAFVYLCLPVIIFNRLHEAHCWAKNGKVRFWAGIAKVFNPVAVAKIPPTEIDVHLACADAREGKIELALARISKYQNDSKVSEQMFNRFLIRVFGNAKNYTEVARRLENSLQEENVYTEELLDYAICLARRQKQTGQARQILERVFERELTAQANLFIPYCQGVIEVEDGNYLRAEFYLQQAAKQMEPFRKNSYLVGLVSEIKAFLSISLGFRGEKQEAARLLAEAKPYLTAHRENELLQRCEEAAG